VQAIGLGRDSASAQSHSTPSFSRSRTNRRYGAGQQRAVC